jgi:hypothetical protein
MMIFKKSVPRRTFLRGAGAALALPLLDCMVPAFGATALNDTGKPPLRISFVYGPNGRIMDRWTPRETGKNFKLSATLEPLAGFRNQMTLISGLNIKAADAVGNEPGGNHARPCAAYLTGIHPRPGGAMGVSADQLVAREFGKHTQLASLELSMDPSDGLGAADGAYSDAYTKTISWRSATTPLPMENNPRKIFERLLGDSDSTDSAARLARIRANGSILDSVMQEAAPLMANSGPADRAKINEYLEAVRDIERRIQLAEQQSARELPAMDRPAGVPATFKEHAKLMFDLQLLAFQSDLTRVISFMLGREQSDRPYREIGISDGHHALSHHAGHQEAIEQNAHIDVYQSEIFAEYLNRLKNTPDGDGSLLDNMLLLYGCGMSDGNLHVHNDVPTLLVGGAGGKIKGGQHVRMNGIPFSNLLISMMDVGGVPTDGFIDSKYSDATGKLDLLTL